MNVGQIKTSLQALGYTSDTAAAQLEGINDVYRRVHGLKRFPWQEAFSSAATIALGSNTLSALPADYLHADALRVHVGTNFRDLTFVDSQTWRHDNHVDKTLGVPQEWTTWAGALWVYPAANAAYIVDLDYVKKVSALVNDADTLIMPDEYHDIIKWGAAAYVAFRERDWQAYTFADKQYGNRLGEMMAEVGVRQRHSRRSVTSSGIWDRYSLVGPGG